MRLLLWILLGLAAAAEEGGKLNTLHSIQEKISHTFSLRRHNQSEPEVVFADGGGHRRLDECGTSYTACLYNAGCLGCVTELSDAAFDDDTLTDDVVDSWSCDQLLYFLQGHGYCTTASSQSGALLCNMIDACDDDDDGNNYYYYYDDDGDSLDDDPCPTNSCNVQHAEWLGDGWCDYDGGCYNTEACGYDGGDCCADTCVDTQYISCGIHGYDCVDPAGQSCSGSDYTLTMYDSYGDGWNGARYTIAEIQTSTEIATGTLSGGSVGSEDICLAAGCYVIVVDSGNWATEVSWALEDIATGGAPAQCAFSIDGSFCDSLSGDYANTPLCIGDDDNKASTDDGCTGDQYGLMLMDSFGDGWNGARYTLREHSAGGAQGALISSGTLNYGFQSTEYMCLAPKCYTMLVTGGSWSSEITWEVGSSGTGTIARAGAPVQCDFPVGGTFCDNTCGVASDDDDVSGGDDSLCASGEDEYVLAMTSSSGNGWGGGSVTYEVKKANGDVVQTGTLNSGSYGEESICLGVDVCYVVVISNGQHSDDASWQIGSFSSGEIASGQGSSSPGGCQFSTNGYCTSSCMLDDDDDDDDTCGGLPGGPSAYELVMYDSAGDGWDGAGFTVTNVVTNTVIETGTLVVGSSREEKLCLPIGCYTIDVSSGGTDSEISWFMSDAGLSGGAPSSCQFHVGPPNPLCPTQCTDLSDDDRSSGSRSCSTSQQWQGVASEGAFKLCTSPKITTDMFEDKNMQQYDWKELDDFEACAFNQSAPNWPESCMALLNQAAATDDRLVKNMAKNLQDGKAETFCICDQSCLAGSPNCKDFDNFNALLHEGIEACNALDAIDCDYLEVYTQKCTANLVNQFGGLDLSQNDQCQYVDAGCGGLDEPELRRWDCLDQSAMSPVEAAFVTQFSAYCITPALEDDENDDDAGHKESDTVPTNDDEPQEDSETSAGKRGHSGDSQEVNIGAAVGGALGGLASLLIICGGAWIYVKNRGKSGAYVPGVTTFSPFFGDKAPSFQQLKTEVAATELSSGAGTYEPVNAPGGMP